MILCLSALVWCGVFACACLVPAAVTHVRAVNSQRWLLKLRGYKVWIR